jgi:hypothetical protein
MKHNKIEKITMKLLLSYEEMAAKFQFQIEGVCQVQQTCDLNEVIVR